MSLDLAQLQREMAAAVMLPLTPDEQMCAEAPDGRAMSEVAGSFIAPNSRLSAFERLEIYNRQYWFRVMGALAEDFPVLRSVVGSSKFERLSIAYLTAHPSRSFTLRNLGSKLPEWLAGHPYFAGRRQRLATDVARIEWAFVEVFDSAERTPLTLDQIATLDADSQLALQPHLQLLALNYAVDDLMLSQHDADKRVAKRDKSEAGLKHEDPSQEPIKLPKLRPRPIWLAAHRVDLSVYYRRIMREEFQMLAAIGQGVPLAGAILAGFQNSRVPQADQPKRLREWFTNWAELGWICAPDLETLVQS